MTQYSDAEVQRLVAIASKISDAIARIPAGELTKAGLDWDKDPDELVKAIDPWHPDREVIDEMAKAIRDSMYGDSVANAKAALRAYRGYMRRQA